MRTSIPYLVTVDGPAASGKSVIARLVAHALHVPYLCTGAMYRAVAWLAHERAVDPRSSTGLERIARNLKMRFRLGHGGRLAVLVEGKDVTKDLQHPEVSLTASTYVAQNRTIRRFLIARQRRCLTHRGLVAEGRDCGSVVFPEAPFKFFLTASTDARARRRRKELADRGIRQSLRAVMREMARRDRQDRKEELGTLQIQPETWIVDNSSQGPDRAVNQMLRRIRGRAL